MATDILGGFDEGGQYPSEVPDGIGGAAHGHVHGDGVLKGLPCDDVPGLDVPLQQVMQDRAGVQCEPLVALVHRRDGCCAGYGPRHLW